MLVRGERLERVKGPPQDPALSPARPLIVSPQSRATNGAARPETQPQVGLVCFRETKPVTDQNVLRKSQDL